MKKVILLIAIVAVFMSHAPTHEIKTYDLEYAIENNLVTCEFKGNDESPHYYQPLIAEITNRTNRTFHIKVANGQKFKSVSPDRQDVVVTQEELIAMTANQRLNMPLFGMCIEKSNTAPNINEIYLPNGKAENNLSLLTKEIERLEAYDVAGQNAVWNITDNGTLYDIAGYDVDAGAPLRTYVANLLNIPDDEIPVFDEPQELKRVRTAGGNFRYKFSRTSAVTIGMVNSQDIIVKELYQNPETPPGEHRLSYEFDVEEFTDDVYYIRLIINGQIKINFEMKTRRS